MSNIGTAVIVVLLYLLTPITGETQFECQGKTVILEFEKVKFLHETSTVNWYMKQNDGETELIAYKVGNDEAIVRAPFAHYAEIDSNLNLVLRNVSSDLNGEYLRRIVNGGIFNSSVNLYVMYAPSGKPIVSKETRGNGTESFNLEMPYLGEPEANVTVKPSKMKLANDAGTIQQYEICLSGRSLQCLKESPCQTFTIKIGQSGIPMQDVKEAPCQNSKIKNQSPKTELRLGIIMRAWIIFSAVCILFLGFLYIYIVFSFCRCNWSRLKNIFNWQLYFGFFPAVFVNFVLSIIDFFVNGFVLNATVGIFVKYALLMGLSFIVLLLMRREQYKKLSAEAGAIEAKETLLRTSEAGNPEETKGLDKTGQYDDIKPGCSHSV